MKMKSDYTLYNQSSIQNYSSIDNVDQAVEYLKDPTHFRSFGQGLTELLQKKNAPVDFSDNTEMADYLFSKLKDIGSTISRATVMSWFTGNHRPKVEAGSRPKIYELCFAMQLTYEETVWFFQHVYYDRAFNCHNIREAVYYYSFLHQLSYQKAQEIIQKIDAAPVTLPVSDDIDTYYTSYVQNTIAAMESADELIDFLIANKADFCHWNKSALHTLHDLISQLIGSKESDDAVNELRTTLYAMSRNRNMISGRISIDIHKYQNCSLLVREILYDAQSYSTNPSDRDYEYILDFIGNRNLYNNSFILDRLVYTHSGMNKNPNIPYIVRNNFPSKKTMSDILSEEKSSVSTSYDSIRKMIVLLDFYRFWLNVKLSVGYTELTKSELTETYIDEANACLVKCGYEELFAANPYDWLFLCAAYSEKPIEYFRACMSPDMWTDDEDF